MRDVKERLLERSQHVRLLRQYVRRCTYQVTMCLGTVQSRVHCLPSGLFCGTGSLADRRKGKRAEIAQRDCVERLLGVVASEIAPGDVEKKGTKRGCSE